MRYVAVSRIETHAFRVPLTVPVETSFGIMRDRPAVFLRIEDEQGVFGWGEIFANWPSAGAEHRARLALEDIAPLLLGSDARQPRHVFRDLMRKTRIRALQCGEFGPFWQAIAGIDTALWDLNARAEGQPLRRLLNPGAADSIPVYASGIDNRKAHAGIAGARQAGHEAFKLKVGFDECDAGRVQDQAKDLGTHEALYLDANQAWSREQAADFLSRIEGCPIGWLEEPIAADAGEAQWRDLAEVSTIPLAGGENVAGASNFQSLIESRVLSFVQPDVAKWGGVSGCFDVARQVIDAGLTYCPHFLGGGIGLLASAELLAASGGPGSLEVDVNPNPLRDAFPVPAVVQGSMRLGDGPGLSVERLPDSLDPYRTFRGEVSQSS
ncbi:mandelate racemase/muconate lactonizing enzyme family protein [Microbaculum marinisediminis]|uniref:Mandelate racemase/muconate lactonizing enzyme family protein n=1 Tax=Microbaculum marinisediminis TaxID=2931392 RepID=A0AAW5QXB5_9HYPH|nr:mandelate racemase/muconate lactonizing enzyme family protein [Microbaculum sp. A6E488]MCT8971116.1 mandelate racemase/muconate lactonizing enzyme family protein [Microbaculum sp. A6E488]